MAMAAVSASDVTGSAVAVSNRDGGGAFVLTCDHASAHIPRAYAGLGLPAADLQRHIAWDIGALGLAEQLSGLLDAPLLHPTVSRLLLDVNRDTDAHDSIVVTSEDTVIRGNHAIDTIERQHRRDWIYAPYHREIETVVAARVAARKPTAMISIHSFTPVFKGVPRRWQVGVLSHRDRRMADPLLRALRADAGLEVGDNQPYAPRDGVYHTLERHAEANGLPCVMLEIRNDLIRDTPGQLSWAERLAPLLLRALEDVHAAEGGGGRR
ncbi:N-formylglutamate amidohydrolase [Pseudoxanthomonas sacheonensis]|uniref:N-formylglutamate amidohydrolase n=1 Tax=Pseudoxanthomonas sacheonensis TaxID=443615 RepID=UPI001BA9BBEF|nr:N-formylglutamate amidohydrolase [Pseudoxanthomonas sacheonensis]